MSHLYVLLHSCYKLQYKLYILRPSPVMHHPNLSKSELVLLLRGTVLCMLCADVFMLNLFQKEKQKRPYLTVRVPTTTQLSFLVHWRFFSRSFFRVQSPEDCSCMYSSTLPYATIDSGQRVRLGVRGARTHWIPTYLYNLVTHNTVTHILSSPACIVSFTSRKSFSIGLLDSNPIVYQQPGTVT